MRTLIVSSRRIARAMALAQAARNENWSVRFADDQFSVEMVQGQIAVYVDTESALDVAKRLDLILMEPPLDLLVRLPMRFLCREVGFTTFGGLSRLHNAAFVKPADPLNKCFDAGIYRTPRDIRVRNAIPLETPVLYAEPVEWLAEYRCFVDDGKIAAISPYLSFGRPVWRPWDKGGKVDQPCKSAIAFCDRLLGALSQQLPPAFVVDVGVIEDRGWAVVEFNPVWCAGLLGVNPASILPLLARVCRRREEQSTIDTRWKVYREVD